ncbi:MAG: hypothetical protein ABEH64_10950 [Salinirussus sp.]
MGLFDKLTGGSSTEDEAVMTRYNCRACNTNFDHDITDETSAACPECGETERIYQV